MSVLQRYLESLILEEIADIEEILVRLKLKNENIIPSKELHVDHDDKHNQAHHHCPSVNFY